DARTAGPRGPALRRGGVAVALRAGSRGGGRALPRPRHTPRATGGREGVAEPDAGAFRRRGGALVFSAPHVGSCPSQFPKRGHRRRARREVSPSLLPDPWTRSSDNA